jgi:putative FmdB family regulatory protein
MPIYEYKVEEGTEGCPFCRNGFEWFQKVSDSPLRKCPKCGASVRKLMSSFSVGFSQSGLDSRAKNAGFHKLERLGKGEYEKKY